MTLIRASTERSNDDPNGSRIVQEGTYGRHVAVAQAVEALPRVKLLTPDQREDIVDVVADAFREYPVPRYVLGTTANLAVPEARRLIEFFVAARVLRGEPMLGIETDGELSGVALLSDPAGPPSPPKLAELREQVWSELGANPRSRYEAFGAATSTFVVNEPHLHLNILAVRHGSQGKGHGRYLLDAVHAVADVTPRVRGVTLTTELRQNVTLYERFGYRVIGHAQVDDMLETWGLYRPNTP